MNEKYKFEFEGHRDAINYLKGIIVAYATECGMRHSSNKTITEDYENGKAFMKDKLSGLYCPSDWITTAHIIYNRLRHERPHKGSFDTDQEHLDQNKNVARSILKDLEGYLGENAAQLMEGF